ncbi:MAG: hypothetical protein QM778_17230 [Myxococcales bacterium]
MSTGYRCPDPGKPGCDDEGDDAGSDEDDDANNAQGDAGEAECEEGDHEVCECSDTEYGERTCADGSFGECEACQVAETTLPRCVAGTYKGVFAGMYRSRASSFGGLTPGMVDHPMFEIEFELRRSGDGEFYTVGGGCFRIPGTETFKQGVSSYGHTFELKGNVDCTTGVIDFELRLIYLSASANQLGGWERIFAKGEMTGRYDPQSKSFVEAKWDLHEKKDLFDTMDPGGSGTLTAMLVEETTGSSSDEACFDVPFVEDLTPQTIPTPTP